MNAVKSFNMEISKCTVGKTPCVVGKVKYGIKEYRGYETMSSYKWNEIATTSCIAIQVWATMVVDNPDLGDKYYDVSKFLEDCNIFVNLKD